MLENLTSAVSAGTLTIQNILICTLASLVFGVVIALVYMYRNTFSKGFVVTIAILPSIVQVVIMMVNGNLGTGVAVAGAFSLVRFRSVPGSARDITTIFFAMAIGLATGTDPILFALVFLVLIGLANIFLFASPFVDPGTKKRMLKITIPETMDYEHIFDDLFEKTTSQSSLE